MGRDPVLFTKQAEHQKCLVFTRLTVNPGGLESSSFIPLAIHGVS